VPEEKKKLKMCPDPDCAKESPADSEDCIACGLPLKDFELFDRMMTVREKIKDSETKKKSTQTQKRRSFFDRR
jgi:hypothetical protein